VKPLDSTSAVASVLILSESRGKFLKIFASSFLNAHTTFDLSVAIFHLKSELNVDENSADPSQLLKDSL